MIVKTHSGCQKQILPIVTSEDSNKRGILLATIELDGISVALGNTHWTYKKVPLYCVIMMFIYEFNTSKKL